MSDIKFSPNRKPKGATPLLSPVLLAALAELAAVEVLPLGALIAVLINKALTSRLARREHT